MSNSRNEFKKSMIWLPASVVGGLIVLAIWWAITAATAGPVAPALSHEASQTPDSTPGVVSPPVEPSTAAEVDEGGQFSPHAVSAADAVERLGCGTDKVGRSDWRELDAPIGGTDFTTGFFCPMGFANSNAYVDYLPMEGATRFHVIAGQPDDSWNTSAVVRFRLVDVVTGAVLDSRDLSFGQMGTFDVPIGGVTRLRLEALLLSSVEELRHSAVTVAWADATFS